jgi:anaerobic selenocysteine-containing dehydrogenase
MEEMQVKKTVCMWCHCHCSVDVHVKDGQLIKVEGKRNRRNSELLIKTVGSCPRALNAPKWFHHPDRLNFPLRRTGERGEGQWERISWEQALDEIAGKLDEIRIQYGPEAVATSSGTGRTHDEYRSRFFNLFGSPNQIGQGHICFGPTNMVSAIMFGGTFWASIGEKTQCAMVWGANPHQAWRSTWLSIAEKKKAGMKLIVIDPRRTKVAERADIWLQIRPGTDCALGMAMINVIINEKLYDKSFVRDWCYGFDELAERAKEYPPEKAAEITWIPAGRIVKAARLYATSKPAIILSQMGLEQLPNSIEALQARYALTTIMGNLDVSGGELIRRIHPDAITEFDIELDHMLAPEQKAKQIGSNRWKLMSFPGYDLSIENVKKTGSEFSRAHNCFAHAPSVFEAMITGKPYPVRAMLTMSSNPVITHANARRVYKAIKSLDLYVVMDFWMTPSAEIADYVLPAASWLERPVVWNVFDVAPMIETGEAALPHMLPGKYKRKRDYDFWRGLGIRLGQKDYWPWDTLEDACNHRLQPLGYTLQEFIAKKDGIDFPRLEKRSYEKKGFATPTGKAELYSTILEKLGYDPLPRYEEPAEGPNNTELADRYPLILITGGRHQPFYHSEHRQIEPLRQIHPDPLVQINPETAGERGIGDGEWVWIETPRGRVRQKCIYFKGIDHRVIHAQHGWWFPELPGEEPWLHGAWESNIDVVTSNDSEHCNKKSGGWPLRTLMCEVYRANSYKTLD